MNESLYLSQESSFRLQKLLDQMEICLKESPRSGLKLQLVRHNLHDLARSLPLSSSTRRSIEKILLAAEPGMLPPEALRETEFQISELRRVYRLSAASDVR